MASCTQCTVDALEGRSHCQACGVDLADKKDELVAMIEEATAAGRDGVGVCDFCRDPGPTHLAICPPFDVQDAASTILPYTSVNEWAMCTPCMKLVRQHARGPLLRRAIHKIVDSQPLLVFLARHIPKEQHPRQAIRDLQAGFWKHYLGEILIIDDDKRDYMRREAERCRADNQRMIDKIRGGS